MFTRARYESGSLLSFFIPGSPLFIYKGNHLRARRAASDVPKSRVFQLEAVVLIGRDFTYRHWLVLWVRHLPMARAVWLSGLLTA